LDLSLNPHLTMASTTTNGPSDWTPASWRSKPIKQCPEYPNPEALKKATAELEKLPPIVHPQEIQKLKQHLRDVARGEAFLLQGGDCAELFDYCRQDAIESKIKLLLQMSLILISGANKRVVRIGRMAGQYAKPRSSPTEIVDGKEVPSFRGDILNGHHLDERDLDPQRLVK
jgi:3-deoxy-7-phosphoheptulonate synthase